MTTLLIDPALSGDELRQRLFDGNLVILTRLRALADFVDYTRGELAELFKPHDPEHVHEHIEPAEMAAILGSWKPRFIHSEESNKLVRAVIEEAGFQAEQTHYDLPKPRTSFPVGHLTTGVAFAFPWHRDVWYSAPAQQINWWLPIFPVRDDNAMSFDLPSFARAVPNSSDAFDYYREQCQPQYHCEAGQQGKPGTPRRHRPSPGPGADPAASPRRGAAILRRSAACLHPEHLRPGPVQRRLPGRQRPRPAGRPRRPPGRRELHRHRHPRLHQSRRRARIDEAPVQDLFGPPPEGALPCSAPRTEGLTGVSRRSSHTLICVSAQALGWPAARAEKDVSGPGDSRSYEQPEVCQMARRPRSAIPGGWVCTERATVSQATELRVAIVSLRDAAVTWQHEKLRRVQRVRLGGP